MSVNSSICHHKCQSTRASATTSDGQLPRDSVSTAVAAVAVVVVAAAVAAAVAVALLCILTAAVAVAVAAEAVRVLTVAKPIRIVSGVFHTCEQVVQLSDTDFALT